MDQSAIDGLTDHVAALRRYAFALTGSRIEAEDLIQETLMRAIAGARSFQRGGNLRGWLFSIMHNAFISTMRKRKQTETSGEDDLPEGVQASDQMIKLELRDVLAALARLPEAQRAAISLIALEEFSYRDAADILGIPIGTLMSRLARGREALRRLLGDEPRPALRVIGEGR
ncbi:MAG: sigma-70 family RNA polymerase sigma factor [Geminicoccaceae bacterium]